MAQAYPKSQQLKSTRHKPKRKELTAITPEVAEEVYRRSGGVCEWCKTPHEFDPYARRNCAEMAHLEGRGQLGRGDQPWNIALLCGPSVNTGTCHNKLDHNRKTYRDWMHNMVEKLKEQYDPSEWPRVICISGGVDISVVKLVVIGRYGNGNPAIVRFLDTTGTPYQVRVEKLRIDGRRMTSDEIEGMAVTREVQAS